MNCLNIFYNKFAGIKHKREIVWHRILLIFVVSMMLCGGCASYNKQTQKINQNWESGNLQAAAALISEQAEKKGTSKDAIVWRLEQGAILRTAGQYEESNRAFDQAEELIDKYEEAAKVKVARETLATVTNLAMLPYEGFAYDKIMMNTYKALNYLQLEECEKARVELNRAYQRQKDAVHINSARIEKAQEEGKKQNYNINLAQINNDAKFKQQYENSFSNLDQFKAHTLYVNPLTVYLDALYFMAQATGSSDLERSLESFERVHSMIGENAYINQDVEMVNQRMNGQPLQPTTYVIFETGQAPERDRIRIDLPLFFITPGLPYVGAAIPKLVYNSDYFSAVNISHDGVTETAMLLSNMDAVIAQDFKNELPIVITKTLVASAIKAGVTYGAYTGVTGGGKKNKEAGLAVLIAASLYQAAMNQADLRTWTTLPKEFHFCRFPTPVDRKIEVDLPYSDYKLPVTIDDGIINVVWVKSIKRNSPFVVTQFRLKDSPEGITIPAEFAEPVVAAIENDLGTECHDKVGQAELVSAENMHQIATFDSEPVFNEGEQPVQLISYSDASLPETMSGDEGLVTTAEESNPSDQTLADESETTQSLQTDAISTEQDNQDNQIEKDSVVKQEIPYETALRLERERVKSLGRKKARQISLLEKKGLKYFHEKSWNSALSVFEKMLEIDPEDFSANANIGAVYLELAEYDLSYKYTSRANQLMPSHPIPYANFTYYYAKMGDKERAVEFLGKAVDRGYKDIDHIKNDEDLPEDFRNDPRLNDF